MTRSNAKKLKAIIILLQRKRAICRLVKQMAEREGVTEQLKADNQTELVARMNNIRNNIYITNEGSHPLRCEPSLVIYLS